MCVATEPFDDTNFDTLIVGGGIEPPTSGLVEFLRQAPGRHRRVASTCLGAFILAEAGLHPGRDGRAYAAKRTVAPQHPGRKNTDEPRGIVRISIRFFLGHLYRT